MKPNTLQVWPEITGYLPALIPFFSDESRGKDAKIIFNNCVSVDSTGLNLLLINILKIIIHSQNIQGWQCISNSEEKIISKIKNLGFFSILTKYGKNPDMFWNENEVTHYQPVKEIDKYGIKITSYPIYNIPFDKYEKRRDALIEFKEWLYIIFEKFAEQYHFSYSHLINIINEIVKNSADHTNGICFLGLDIISSNNKNSKIIRFSIGDVGVGINKHIKNHLPPEETQRYDYWDLTQTYRLALKNGHTSKPFSKENGGIGLPMIVDGARNIGLKLSVFDAKSRGILSDITTLTHENIRNNFYSVKKKVGFYYYGELTIERKT